MKQIKALLILCGFMLLTFSCTRTSHLIINKPKYKVIAEFNYLGKNKNGYIKFSSGSTVISKWLKLQNDTLKYVPQNSDSIRFINIAQVNSVYFKNHVVSLFDGLLIGFFSGLAPGLFFYDADVEMSGLITLGFGLGGAVIGAVSGAIKGSKLVYRFNSENYNREAVKNKRYLYEP